MPDQSSTTPPEQRAVNIARVSTVTATAIAVADMIGIGVFTSLGFQVRGIPSAFALLAALDRGRHHRTLRGARLCRTGSSTAAVRRRVQFPVAHLPSRGRISGGLGVCNRGFRCPHRCGGHGFWNLLRGGISRITPVDAWPRLGLDRVPRASERGPAEQHVPERLDGHQGGVDRGVHHRRLCLRQPATHLVRAVRAGPHLHLQRTVRDQPRLRHVLLLGLERRHLHHQRGARSREKPSALASRRDPDRACALRRI